MGGLLGKPKTPTLPPPTPMPVPDDEQSRAAKRRADAAAQTRGGRSSTILSDSSGSDTLG